MADRDFGPVVSTGWLAERLGDPGLRILDATWYLPTLQRDAAFAAPPSPEPRQDSAVGQAEGIFAPA